MKTLLEQIQQSFPASITLPIEIIKLIEWIEQAGSVVEYDGLLTGSLPTENDEDTYLEVFAEENTAQWWCFDHADIEAEELKKRIHIFARTGADGSCAAFWLDDEGKQKIVHIGSGSGSSMMCVLADNTLDFLRLLAIGYEEICWNDEYNRPPKNVNEKNKAFKQWLISEFNVSIPSMGSEIVPSPVEMWNVNSEDAFCRWVSQFNQEDF